MELSELRPRLKRVRAHAAKLTEAAIGGFFDDRCTQLAAGMAYFALFSLFPLAILFTAAFGLVVAGEDARNEVVEFIVERLPLSDGQGAEDIRILLEQVSGSAEALGIAGLAGVLFSASALMGAVRNSLNAVWDLEDTRPPLRAKAFDILLVFGLGVLISASLVATVLQRTLHDAATDLGIDRDLLAVGFDVIGFLLPVLLSVTVFTIVLRIVPEPVNRVRDVWPGIVVATLGYELAKRGFAIYLENFSNYSAVYGSLGAVVAFLVFVYVAAMVFLLGAEYARAWPDVRDEPRGGDGDEEGEPFGSRLLGWLKGLVIKSREPRRRE